MKKTTLKGSDETKILRHDKNLNRSFPCPWGLPAPLQRAPPPAYARTRPQWQACLLNHGHPCFPLASGMWLLRRQYSSLDRGRGQSDPPLAPVGTDISGELYVLCQYTDSLKPRGWCRTNRSDNLGRYWATPDGSSQLKYLLTTLLPVLYLFHNIIIF